MKPLYLFLLIFISSFQAIAQLASFQSRGVGGGGALFFGRINPANDNEFYIACDMSEMFHSTDFGSSYSQLHFSKMQSLNVSTYEFTNDPMIAYNNFNDGNNGYPVKTTDGGNTWTKLTGFNASNGEVYNMYANYKNKNQLVMGYYGSIVISNDGGSTFTNVCTAISSGSGVTLGGVFYDSLNIYVATNQGLYYSTNGGAGWSIMTTSGITSGQVIWSFSGAKVGGTTRFACIATPGANTYVGLMPYDYYGMAKAVYTMDNANGVWVPRVAGINFANDFVMYTGMAWNDINTIYLGGHDNLTGGPLVYKSTDGGTTWAKIFKTTTNQNIITGWSGQGGDKAWSWGETTFGMTVAPYNSSKILFGDFSFVHVSSDGGANWKQAYVSSADQHPANAPTPAKQTYHSIGLENTSCWQVTWQSPDHMMAAFSDIGAIRSIDSGKSWGYTYTGMNVNSTYRIASTPGGTLYAGTSGIHDIYQSTRLKDAQLDAADAAGNINYSTDNGATWNLVHNFNHPVFWLAIDPTDSNKMYASVINHAGTGAAGGIWMTSNLSLHAGSTWTMLPPPTRTEGHPASIVVLNNGKVLCTYSGHIDNTGQFANSSGVFLYDPATTTWNDLSNPNMIYWTKDIIVDPNDATQNTWYACVFSHWGSTDTGQGGLYRTKNAGANWYKLSGSKFDRVTSITFDPQNKNHFYLTTETQGLWESSNANSIAPVFDSIRSYPFRQPERVFFNPYDSNQIWVSSFGNGMKVGYLKSIASVPVFNTGTTTLELYPNPASDKLNIIIPPGNLSNTICIYNTMGQLVSKTEPDNKNIVEIDVHTLPAGIYWVHINNKTAKFVKD